MEKSFKSLHQILRDSADNKYRDPEIKGKTPTTSLRLDETTKLLCQQICQQNGTDLSTFLRGVCDQLLKEYMP